jgi:hypothetical protein
MTELLAWVSRYRASVLQFGRRADSNVNNSIDADAAAERRRARNASELADAGFDRLQTTILGRYSGSVRTTMSKWQSNIARQQSEESPVALDSGAFVTRAPEDLQQCVKTQIGLAMERLQVVH